MTGVNEQYEKYFPNPEGKESIIHQFFLNEKKAEKWVDNKLSKLKGELTSSIVETKEGFFRADIIKA